MTEISKSITISAVKKGTFTVLFVIFALVLFAPVVSKSADILPDILAKFTTVALRDPFYPNYPQRRIFFPTINPYWWGSYGLTKYTITSKDPRVGNKTVTFYSTGYSFCPNGNLEMGLPFGPTSRTCYNHFVCSLTTSDDYNFLFPAKPIVTKEATLDSPATISVGKEVNATVYLPRNWWSDLSPQVSSGGSL